MQTNLRAVLALLVLAVPAAVRGQSAPDGGPSAPPVKIVLYPAPEPRPALKYQLLPPFLERRPGNAAVWWNRLPAERKQFFADFEKEFDDTGRIDTWMNIPLGDPREKEYREKELAKVSYLLGGGGVYSDMERAARFESCDWQLPVREGNYIAVLLPEVQQSRMYARLLAAKAHLEIAKGKYDEAVRMLQTGYAEGRHVAQGPTIINSLVGVTIAGIMSHQVQQFIQRPDSPNLYWALSTLPRPLVDFRLGGEAESNVLYLQCPELRDLDKKELSPDEWRELLKRIVQQSRLPLSLSSPSPLSPDTYTAAITALAVNGYPRAKRYLVERGRTAAEVEAMPVAQVVLLYTVKYYDELSDAYFKWFYLPASEAGDGARGADRELHDALAARQEIIPFASFLLPAITAAKEAETRCQWNLAMLRIFEALRLYAAGHEGRWPDRLSDITEVPVPTNPYDGKPFVYERRGGKAVLTSQKGPPSMPWRHEITFMPKAK
jgi:hypothetical protein